ncbi:hypothetical protein ACH4ZX_37260 [Streptomyces sp. NPDC020490]|uniref:hypothetical protein n=1 Tax=Streptomyces sp. NPDC020490 TaxID=3365078 RepID=UPI00378A7851
MRTRGWGTAVAVCCAASLAAAGAAPSAAGPAPPAASAGQVARQRPRTPVLVDCLWHPRVRPAGFMLACGDGNSRLTALHWSRWGPESATAEGVNAVNDCEPYCAAGTFHSYRVTVRLGRPEPWKKRPHVRHFTRLTLEYHGSRPDIHPRTVTLPLWN